VRQLFVKQNIHFPRDASSADEIRHVAFLKLHLKDYFGNEPFDVQDLGDSTKNPIKTLLTGDIIYFTYKNDPNYALHIGIIVKSIYGNKTYFHSSGAKNNCVHNSSIKGGIQDAGFVYLKNTSYVWHVVRISVP
jgi:hypothetical protein